MLSGAKQGGFVSKFELFKVDLGYFETLKSPGLSATLFGKEGFTFGV